MMALNPHSEYCCCCDLQAAAQRSQRKMTISCARKSKITESWF